MNKMNTKEPLVGISLNCHTIARPYIPQRMCAPVVILMRKLLFEVFTI